MDYYVRPKLYNAYYGTLYVHSSNVIFTYGTLYKIGDKGLVVIQQYYDPETKSTSWGPIETCLIDAMYTNPNFQNFFEKHADIRGANGYPWVTIRSLMHGLGLKPLKRYDWETRF